MAALLGWLKVNNNARNYSLLFFSNLAMIIVVLLIAVFSLKHFAFIYLISG